MKPKDREASLAKIKSSSTTRVILISLKAGSTGAYFFIYFKDETSLLLCDVGLNLTACNNVILVDMWWNPALEVRRRCPW